MVRLTSARCHAGPVALIRGGFVGKTAPAHRQAFNLWISSSIGAGAVPRGFRGQSEGGVPDLTDQTVVGPSTALDAPPAGTASAQPSIPKYSAVGDGCDAHAPQPGRLGAFDCRDRSP